MVKIEITMLAILPISQGQGRILNKLQLADTARHISLHSRDWIQIEQNTNYMVTSKTFGHTGLVLVADKAAIWIEAHWIFLRMIGSGFGLLGSSSHRPVKSQDSVSPRNSDEACLEKPTRHCCRGMGWNGVIRPPRPVRKNMAKWNEKTALRIKWEHYNVLLVYSAAKPPALESRTCTCQRESWDKCTWWKF